MLGGIINGYGNQHVLIGQILQAGVEQFPTHQASIKAGYDVLLNDISMEYVQKNLDNIEKNLMHDVEKGHKTEDEKETVLSRVQLSNNKKDSADCQLIIKRQ